MNPPDMPRSWRAPLKDPQILRVYTIYKSPADHPGKFVIREWEIRQNGHAAPGAKAVCDSLVDARAFVPGAADYRIPRSPDDEPQIVETWI